jgi:hypothetical protein
MSKQIKRTDIVEKDIFKNLIDSADASISKLKLMNDQFVVMAKTIKSSMKTAKFDTTKELNEFIKATKNATTVSKEQVKVMQELEKANALKSKAQQELIRVEKEQLKLQDQAIKTARTKLTDDEKQEKINARKQKSIDDESNAYKRLEKNTRDLKNSSKQLGAELLELERAGKKNTKEYGNLERKFNDVTRQAQKGDQALKKLDKTVGDNFRNVGNYRDALGSLQGILSSVGIAFGLSTIVQGATKSIIGFEQANATLSAVLGKTSAETQDLQKIQRELGRTSGFTATQVGELQIELARLGFTENEIKGATESVLLLAKATGSDLGRASEVAGATLRGFGLNANEIGRVVDVMAKSFDMSALGMENFAESMKYVAPVASSAGVSIEQTTAMLGALSNAGIQGSQAGTSLRRILTDMALTGKPAKEALEQLATKGITLTDAMDEVGRSAQTSLLVLAKNMDSVNGMTTAFENADGAVVKTATTMGDTLQGSINRLRGAWEAWLLDLNEGTGASNSFRDAIDFLTKNLATILNLVVTLSEIWIKYKIITLGQIAVNKLMASSFVQTIRSAESLGGVMRGLGGLIQKVGTAIKNNLAGIALFVIGNIIMKYKELNDIYATTKSNAEELANAQNDIATNLKKETIEAGALFEALKNTNNGSVERSALITEINGKYGTTLENLKDEKKFVDQVNTSYNDLIATMTAKAEMEGIRIKFEMSQGQLAKAEMDYSQAVDNYNEYINNASAGSKVLDELLTNFGVTSEKDLEDIKDAYFTVFASATKQADIYKDDFIKSQSKIALSKKESTKTIVSEGKKVEESTKKEIKAVKELDTTFNEFNRTISEQANLLNELDAIYKNRAINLKTDEVKAEYDKQIRLAEETGVANVDLMEQLLQEETNLKKKQAQDNLDFKINQLEQEFRAFAYEKQKELDLEKATLLAQEGITPEAKTKIEANYLIKQKELNALVDQSNTDLQTKKTLEAEKTSDEILKIEQDKNNQINELNDGVYDALKTHSDKINDLTKESAQETIDTTTKANDEKLAKTKQFWDDMNKLTQMSATYFIKQSDKKIAQAEKEIDALTTQKNFLEQLAVNGNITAEKSLAQNEKLTIEQNKKKAKEIKKQERIKLAESVFTSYTANVANNEKNPIFKTISDITVLTAFINSLPTFYKGTERTVGESLGMPQLSGRDGHIVRVDGSEKILNPTLSKMTGNMTTLEIAQLAEDKLRGKIMSKGGSTIQLLETNYSNDVIVEKLDQLNNTILNKPEMNVEVGEILGGVMHVVESTKNTRQTVRNITRFS